MEKLKPYYGLIILILTAAISVFAITKVISPVVEDYKSYESKLLKKQDLLKKKQSRYNMVKETLKNLNNSVSSAQKKIFAPTESDLGDSSLFFAMYQELFELLHSNSIKIKSIESDYNPKDDKFVQYGKEDFFVSDVNLKLISNYKNLDKLLQDIYQYPYYIKINSLKVEPYAKDKKILLTDLSLRLYSRTEPVE